MQSSFRLRYYAIVNSNDIVYFPAVSQCYCTFKTYLSASIKWPMICRIKMCSCRLQLVVPTFFQLFTQFSLMFFLCKQLLEFCDLLDTCHMSFNLHLLFRFVLNTHVPFCNLQFGGLAYYKPRPARTTLLFGHVTLLLSITEVLHRPDPSRIQNVYNM